MDANKKKPTEKMISVRGEDYEKIVKLAKNEQRTIRSIVERMIALYEKS